MEKNLKKISRSVKKNQSTQNHQYIRVVTNIHRSATNDYNNSIKKCFERGLDPSNLARYGLQITKF